MALNLLKGDRIGSKTDYRDYLPVNMTGVSKKIHGAAGFMVQMPGLTHFGDGVGIDRGAVWNDRLKLFFRVSGERLISISTDGTTAELGTITGTDAAAMPYSFNTQAIIAGKKYYLYDKINGFRQVAASGVNDVLDGEWIDGYYVFTDGEYLYSTKLINEEEIQPGSKVAEFMPDKSLGIAKTTDNKMIVFGRYSTEYLLNSASTGFVFTRISSRAIKAGIVGTHAKCEINDRFFILGGRKGEDISVHILSVGSAKKVASREIDKIINEFSEQELEDVVLEGRVGDGYSFLIVHLPNKTVTLNLTIMESVGIENSWSILKSDVMGDNEWRAKHGAYDPRTGKWMYGDKIDGRTGYIDDSVATHYDQIVEWELRTPFVKAETLSIDELEMEVVPGYTLYDDATVFASLTHDGSTYGMEYAMNYGSPSDYGKRFIMWCLGYVESWVGFKFRGASKSRVAFSLAKIKAS